MGNFLSTYGIKCTWVLTSSITFPASLSLLSAEQPDSARWIPEMRFNGGRIFITANRFMAILLTDVHRAASHQALNTLHSHKKVIRLALCYDWCAHNYCTHNANEHRRSGEELWYKCRLDLGVVLCCWAGVCARTVLYVPGYFVHSLVTSLFLKVMFGWFYRSLA